MGLDAVLGRERGGVGDAAQLGRRAPRPRDGRSGRCGTRPPARRGGSPPRSGAGSGSMNRLTRMFARAQPVDISKRGGCAGRRRRGRPRWCAPRASRGRCRRRGGGGAARSSSISSVAAISRFSGISSRAISRSISLVGDVAAVLAQMGGDAVGAGLGGGEGGADRIGMRAAARVPDRRDMVDVDAEAEVRGHAAFRLPGFSAGIAASSGGSSLGPIARHVEADQREEGHAEIGRAVRPVDQGGGGDRPRRRPPRPPRIASREREAGGDDVLDQQHLLARRQPEAAAQLERARAAARRTSPRRRARGPFHGR